MPNIPSGIDTSDIVIRILRSNRKSVVGRVLPDGSVEVRAPLSMTTSRINEWLDKFEPKFRPMVDEARKTNAYVSGHPFGYGGEMLYRGEWMPIKQAEDGNGGYMALYRDGAFTFYPGLTENDMRRHIESLLTDLARPIFEEKLRYYSSLMNVNCKTWTIGNARKRHGSCDSNRKIILSWRIVMMSDSVMDYVIVHELAHLKQMNHAKGFHSEVAAILPDWKERQAAHSKYSHVLRCGGWI